MIRAAGLYLVGAWLVVQVAGTILPMFGAADWIARSIVIALATGFLPAMIVAWVFELTPDGLKRDAEVTTTESIAPQTARRMDRLMLIVAVIAIGYFAFDKFVLAPRREAALVVQTMQQVSSKAVAEKSRGNAKSIAVLAFANMSADKDNEYFADGISEEILNALAQVRELSVAGRTSSFYFKGRNEPLSEIGATLGVAHVLEGSVRKQGDRLRITAQLIRVSVGFHLWSETFDGTDADVFALQESIARRVTNALKVALDTGPQKRLVDAGTRNAEAYALFLQASDVFNRRVAAEFRHAMTQLETATRLDPDFARAYSKLAALQILAPHYLGTDLATSTRAAESNARRALVLQPDLAEPRAVIAFSFDLQKRYLAARAEYEKALAIEPDDLLTNFWFSTHLMETGYLGERVARLQRVLALDPLLPNALNHFGATLEWQGDLQGARQAMERAKTVGSANSDLTLGFVSLRQGRTVEAKAELARALDLFGANLPRGTGDIIASGVVEGGEGRLVALKRVRELAALPASRNEGVLAWALMLFGEHEHTFAMIVDRPLTTDMWNSVLWSPRGKAARTSPAFPEFARKVGFVDVWERYGPPDLCKKDASGDYRCE